jgi:hemolysin activation/secretion protein
VRDPEISAITWINSAGNPENIYDSLQRIGQFRAVRYRGSLKISSYIPFKPWLVLKLGLEGMVYRAPVVYFNELERFGGIKNLRGFNEQSIFASEFSMATVELRFVSGNTGYLAPFYHLGRFRDGSGTVNPTSGYLHGMGIQTAFTTAAGILNLAWALGKSGTSASVLPFEKHSLHITPVFCHACVLSGC